MNHLRVITRAILWTAFDRAAEVMAAFLLPKAGNLIKDRIQKPANPWITSSLWTRKTIDGAIIEGVSNKAGAKYAIPKGLPVAVNRALAIENEPHEVDGFSGEIHEGYGKGGNSPV